MTAQNDGETTDTSNAFAWGGAGAEFDATPQPHLVIAWCEDDPTRVGEVAHVSGPMSLGRGVTGLPEGVSRVAFQRQRPGGWAPRGPLEGPRLSRKQLSLEPLRTGLSVSNEGRSPLRINGERASKGVVHDNDTLLLEGGLLLLVRWRPARLADARHISDAVRGFEFATADPSGFVGESHAAWRLRDVMAFAAAMDKHALIQGESGTGKELVARGIHELSSRGSGPFVSRSAATLPETLVDAELFGTAKDFPNSGMPLRRGLIGEADGGTLFLDEIGELPVELQARLLRVMDSGGEYQRLGDSQRLMSDLRVLAATNRPTEALKSDVAARFRVRIEVPPLDERREDIPLLVRHTLRQMHADAPAVLQPYRNASGHFEVDPLLLEALLRHEYVTQVRELERLLLTALSSSHGSHIALTPEVQASLKSRDTGAVVAEGDQPEREQVQQALDRHNGNVTRAAKELGLSSRFALYRVMKRLDIERG